MAEKLKAVGDRMIVRPATPEEKTKAGIFIPETSREKPQTGEVLSAGEGSPVSVGDEVIFSKYAGVDIGIDNLVVLRPSDVLALVVG